VIEVLETYLIVWRTIALRDREVIDALVDPSHAAPSPQLSAALAHWPGRYYWSDEVDGRHLVLTRRTDPPATEAWWLHALLLAATVLCTTYAGAVFQQALDPSVMFVWSGLVTLDREFLNRVFTRVDQSIAMAALFTAYHLKVKAIAALTQSGSTALWISRLNCGVPIYALTPEISTRYRLSLYRDVYPLMIKYIGHDRDYLLQEAENQLVSAGLVQRGDLIVITFGEPIGAPGGTNTMKIVKVGESHRP